MSNFPHGLGYVTRPNGIPPIRIVRGETPESTKSTHEAARIPAPAPGVAPIYSGQVIHKDYSNAAGGAPFWKLGGATGKRVFFAYQDANKSDVEASGMLTGIPADAPYILATGHFTGNASTFTEDTPLTYDGATGKLKVAGGADPIVARVTKHNSAVSTGAADNNTSPTGGMVIFIRTGV